MKNFTDFIKENQQENPFNGYYIIYYGLGGGFGGANISSVIQTTSADKAGDEAYQRACEEYSNYEGSHGLRSIEDIVEEDEVDEEDAEMVYNDERESWLDYWAEPYSPEEEKKARHKTHFDNPYEKEYPFTEKK